MTIKRSNKKFGIRAEVKLGGEVVVTAGYMVKDSEILDFVSSHSRWIATHSEKMQSKAETMAKYKSGDTILLHGKDVSVEYIMGSGKSYFDGEAVHIYYTKDRERAMHIWYMRYATKYLTDMFHAIVGDICKVNIRYVKTYYGICYNRKNKDSYISLNAKLIGATDDVIRHVIYHEVTHLKVPNHSRAFYEALALLEPNHRAMQTKLKALIVE